MIRISHEMPLFMLKNGDEEKYNDYGYALVHLFECNEEYYNYYVNLLRNGKQVYLDNSVFELEKAFDVERFVFWLKKLSADSQSNNIVYVIPDVLDNALETVESAKSFTSTYSNLPGKSLCVMQGTTFQELIDCYIVFEGLKISYIGVSFNCKAYDNYLPDIKDELVRWKRARQSFVEFLALHNPPLKPKSLHLLGCALPDEFRFYVEKGLDKLIMSLDTSNPVVHGLLNIKYTGNNGLSQKESIKLCNLIDSPYPSQETYSTIMHNLNEFKRINLL